MAFYAGLGGVFGVAWHGFNLVTGSGTSRFDAEYWFIVSLLFIATGVTLWRGTDRGWWLGWSAMIFAALSGFVTGHPESWSSTEFTPFVTDCLMLAAAGIFFCSLAHRDVYGPCFKSATLPHAVLVATPALLILVGCAALTIAGDFGLFAGPFILVVTFVAARWIFTPLRALLRGQSDWHDS